MEIRNHPHFITESERLRLDDIGAAHHIPFESNKIFLIERERIPAREPLWDGRFRKVKGFAFNLNPLIEFLDCWNVVVRKWLNNYRHTQAFLTFPKPMMLISSTPCTALASSFAEQSAKEIMPFSPAKAPNTPLQETTP
jgi:hypothetical protein